MSHKLLAFVIGLGLVIGALWPSSRKPAETPPAVLPPKSGKVIALGTTEAKRSAATPDIPAISESAQYKNVDIGVWFALMAPAHLPKPVFDKLKKALNEALQAPELRKKLESSGSTVSSPSVNIDKFLAAEVAKYKQIVEFAKIEE